MEQTIEQVTAHVLTEIKEHSTKVKPTNIPTIETLAEYFKFDLCNDPELRKLMDGSKQFLDAAKLGESARWLTMLGSSGAGKTFLARKIQPLIQDIIRAKNRADGREFAILDVAFYDWPTVVDRLRDGEYHVVQELIDIDVLVLDEIGAEIGTEFVFEKLCRVFNGRLGKWTIFTGNITPKALAEADTRLASRIYRDKNIVVSVNTKDYAWRKRVGV